MLFSRLPPLLEYPPTCFVLEQSDLVKSDQVANSICLCPCSKAVLGGHDMSHKKGDEISCQYLVVNQSLETEMSFLPTHLVHR